MTQRTRRITLAVVIAGLLLAVPSAAQAVTNPTQGAYVSCTSFSQCAPHLDRLRFIGIKIIVTPPTSSFWDNAYLDSKANDLGMRIFWTTPYESRNATTEQFMQSAANWAGTTGFYVADEPSFRSVSPSGLAGWSHWWEGYGNGSQNLAVHWGCSAAEVQTNAGPYVAATKWVGNDCYPKTDGDGDGYEDAGYVGPGFRKIRDLAVAQSKWPVAVPKAFSWTDLSAIDPTGGTDNYPSEVEMRVMLDCARAANVGAVIWFGYNVWQNWLTTHRDWYDQRFNPWAQAVMHPYASLAELSCR